MIAAFLRHLFHIIFRHFRRRHDAIFILQMRYAVYAC